MSTTLSDPLSHSSSSSNRARLLSGYAAEIHLDLYSFSPRMMPIDASCVCFSGHLSSMSASGRSLNIIVSVLSQ